MSSNLDAVTTHAGVILFQAFVFLWLIVQNLFYLFNLFIALQQKC